MSGPSAPPAPPDPVRTAQAQAQTNRDTAITQYGLNATNQNTPQGSLTYNQIGTWQDGTPRYEQNVTLSPEQQNLYNLGVQTQSNLGNIGVQQSQKIGDILNTPVNLSNEAVEGRLFDLANARLEPQLARDWNNRETALMNRGIMPGMDAYTQEQDAFNRQKNDLYNQLALTGRGQAITELLAGRNQPINEITALMSGSQVSMPNFGNRTPQSSIASPDLAGMTYDAYRMGPLAGWQAQNAYDQAFMGGLFGMGGAALGGWGRGGFQNPFGQPT